MLLFYSVVGAVFYSCASIIVIMAFTFKLKESRGLSFLRGWVLRGPIWRGEGGKGEGGKEGCFARWVYRPKPRYPAGLFIFSSWLNRMKLLTIIFLFYLSIYYFIFLSFFITSRPSCCFTLSVKGMLYIYIYFFFFLPVYMHKRQGRIPLKKDCRSRPASTTHTCKREKMKKIYLVIFILSYQQAWFKIVCCLEKKLKKKYIVIGTLFYVLGG